jgi:hypothetical protein
VRPQEVKAPRSWPIPQPIEFKPYKLSPGQPEFGGQSVPGAPSHQGAGDPVNVSPAVHIRVTEDVPNNHQQFARNGDDGLLLAGSLLPVFEFGVPVRRCAHCNPGRLDPHRTPFTSSLLSDTTGAVGLARGVTAWPQPTVSHPSFLAVGKRVISPLVPRMVIALSRPIAGSWIRKGPGLAPCSLLLSWPNSASTSALRALRWSTTAES